ncbi:DEAD/DEAH box helicase family protein [Desulfococcus multivorans]|uniref:Type III restriction protein res subunit n=1 Tax=Desulfococcus multivorans DSM 2059 TaxID=1121405 RepID=S7U268_DESML|nr:DEAD/DEAH box helicase family protein [Desulfococcus multivorans]AOY59572.1 restriction endonuclease, type I, subunit R type III [Desulfococcus multivorans]AQV01764.1 restriction endonuclease subunit R [Desulfococcus multivorans]EPR43541.1 type III restriction protein res subunit [Desulfococcus multivorans DSM 2059]SKA25463.1 type I restriction enzyme, R subunit [Desulfococcus multivorans DSM 2059]
MSYNEQETRFFLIDPVLRDRGYNDHQWIKMETPAPVEPTGPKGRRRKGSGRTDYLLCVQVGDMPKALPVGVLEAKKETEDPLKGMQQAKGYADCRRFEVKYVFATNGHFYGEFDYFTNLQGGPFPFSNFPPHLDLTARYAKNTGIDISKPEAAMLFQADSPAWSLTRYYQDAAIRAAFEKIIRCRQQGETARVLLTLATGSGKTIIATNLLWRLGQAGQLPKPALFLCDRDELREQAYTKLKAAFGDNVRIVKTEKGGNAAANARIHIATYQTLGLDDEDDGFASFLSQHYGEDAFSVIIIDECHRSAWGKWSEVLKRNGGAIHIGLTATPRKLQESKHATAEDQEITANNHKYFGEPVYEYTLIQAQEDGYLAACEIVKRKADIDKRVFTKEEILKAAVKDIRTGKPLTEADLTKDEYTGKDFDDELFIELRTPTMCEDLFRLLCANGGPEQKVIIFCNREIHADRVAMQMNNLYARWCKEHNQTPKDHYAFKCMGGPNNGADMIEPMRGSGERAFIACTVDLLEAGVDIERLNAVVFFRYLQSPIKFYQMVGRGTRIHEETQKYKFWLYDYTDVTNLFGTDFITKPPRPRGGGDGGDDGGIIVDPPWPPPEPPSVAEMGGHWVTVTPQGRFILTSRGGRDTPIPVDEYRREVIQRVVSEAHNLDEFRQLWIETQKRRSLINHLLGDNFSPEVIREIDQMTDFDLYDFFGHHGYKVRALKRTERGNLYISSNAGWFGGMDAKAAVVLKGLGHQFSQGGTEALETPALWEVPEIKLAGGLAALKKIGKPVAVMHEAKGRLFGV